MTRPDPALAELAKARALAADALDAATELLINAIAAAIRAGQRVNISAIADSARLSRQTVYSRLDELGVDR
jgi:DNA-binding IclR family transcriptional regulator